MLDWEQRRSWIAIVELDNCVLSAIGIWKSPSVCSRDNFTIISCSNTCQANRVHFLDSLEFCGTVGKNAPLLSTDVLKTILFSLRFLSLNLGPICRWELYELLAFFSYFVELLNICLFSFYPYWIW